MRNILTALLCLATLTGWARLTVTRITCELREGLTVTERTPRLGWQMTSNINGDRQTAYQIKITNVATGRVALDTGRKSGSKSQLVPAEVGEGSYMWQVRVWDKDGVPSAWSQPSEFVRQTVAAAFGTAQWVGAITRADAHTPEGRTFTGRAMKEAEPLWAAANPLSRRSIYVRRAFNPQKAVRHALLNVCGLGFSEITIGGKKVGESEFAPLWSDYDRTAFYNTYDVTALLNGAWADNPRPVDIQALLGNGFYNEQGGRYHKLNISFGPPTLKLRLHVTYTDGTTDDVVTDTSWQYSPSEIVFNSIYGGEDYDARICREWHPAVVQEGPRGVLRPQMAPPVKVMRRYAPVACHILTTDERKGAEKIAKHTLPEGTFVLDMGQNLAGVPEITVQGKPGQMVRFYTSETLTAEGACNQRQTGRPHYYTYIIKGTGVERYRPRFSYYGFRYIQVEGAALGDVSIKGLKDARIVGDKAVWADTVPVIKSIESCFVHNSASTVSEFECSNELVNKTHTLIDMATRSNMQSVFTDCPHREKLGWLEQDWLCGHGLFMNYNLTGFAPQTMRNIADAQHENGAVPTTAPEFVLFRGPGMDAFAESPEWGGTFIDMPYTYYKHYGDTLLLSEYYPQMLRYVDYLATQDSCGILRQGLGDWYDYGDFRSGFSRNTSVPLVSTAHHYRWTALMADIATLLGKPDDAKRLSSKAAQIKAAWQKEFYMGKAGRESLHRSQTALSIMLTLHLCPERDRGAVLDALIADIHAHGDRLTTGDIGNRYLFETLCTENQHELLYKMLNHYDVPGYGFQMKHGMTTLSEQWDPANGSSMNHFMMGHIDGFHFTSLAGINISGNRVTFRPQPAADLTWARAATETPYGRVAIEWHRLPDGSLSITPTVPVGMTYSVVLDDK